MAMAIDTMADDLTTPVAEKAAAGEERTDADFTGTAAEYFRIWIVGALLTIITAGLYSPWATVRNKRYFYGNTRLGGADFEYHAKPLTILAARLVLLAMLVAVAYWAGGGEYRNVGYSLALAVLLPWAMARGLSFSARNSSFAGVRFSFKCDFWAIYLIYSPLLVFNGLLLYNILTGEMAWVSGRYGIAGGAALFYLLLLPLFVRAYYCHKAGRYKLGGLRFYLHNPPVLRYYGALVVPFLCAAGFVILTIGLLGFIAIKLGHDQRGMLVTGYNGFVFFSAILLSVVVLAQFVRAALFRLFWGNLRAGNDKFGGRFVCDINIADFAMRILLVNAAAVVISLGLLHPWARIRKTRYLVQRIHIIAPAGTMASLTAPGGKGASPLGEEFEAAEGFDFDAGLI